MTDAELTWPQKRDCQHIRSVATVAVYAVLDIRTHKPVPMMQQMDARGEIPLDLHPFGTGVYHIHADQSVFADW